MTAVTKATKSAKDGASTPAVFTAGMADESGAGTGPFTPYVYIAEPAAGALITPSQDGTDSTGVTQLTGGVGIRGWLSGIFSKLSNTLSTTMVATNNGGCLVWSAPGGTGNALLTSTPVQIKGGNGSLYGFRFHNEGSADAFVQIFDLLAGSVTLGTTVPKDSIWVPAGGYVDAPWSSEGKVSFTTGLTVAATTTKTGSGTPVTGIHSSVYYH